MATIAEPHPVLDKAPSRARRSARRHEPTSQEIEQARIRHKRNEIIGLIAFGLVLLVVFLMRNYAS
jgi:hypothetical protein